MNKVELIVFGIVHNLNVLFCKFQLEFYILFDKVEMLYWKFKNKGRTAGDYHLQKTLTAVASKDNINNAIFYAAVKYLTYMGVDINNKNNNYIFLCFHTSSINHFYFDSFTLNLINKYCNIKTMGDIIDMAAEIKAVLITEIIIKIGKDKYEKLRKLDYSDLSSISELLL